MDTVRLAGRTLNRIGLSLAGLKATGMWGEPADRHAALRVVRRAVELGVQVLEVPLPFGPFADLAREAATAETFLVARLTGPVGVDVATRRLGRPPDLVLTPDGATHREHARSWPVPRGLVTARIPPGPVAAVGGPFPAPPDLLEWCEERQIPYLAPSTAILDAGRHTVAVPALANVSEVERLLGTGGPTPPAGGPG